MNAKRGEETKAYALLTLTALFWASTVIAGRAVAGEVPPLAINFGRWTVAFLVAAADSPRPRRLISAAGA